MVRAAAVAFLVALLPPHALVPDGLRNGLVAVAEVDPPPQDVGEELKTWDRIKRSNDVSELEAFVARYKDTFLANLARRRIEQLRSQRAGRPIVAPAPVPLTPSPSAAVLFKKPVHTHYSRKSRRGNIAQPRWRETAMCPCYRSRVRLPPRLRPLPKRRTLARGRLPARIIPCGNGWHRRWR